MPLYKCSTVDHSSAVIVNIYYNNSEFGTIPQSLNSLGIQCHSQWSSGLIFMSAFLSLHVEQTNSVRYSFKSWRETWVTYGKMKVKKR